MNDIMGPKLSFPHQGICFSLFGIGSMNKSYNIPGVSRLAGYNNAKDDVRKKMCGYAKHRSSGPFAKVANGMYPKPPDCRLALNQKEGINESIHPSFHPSPSLRELMYKYVPRFMCVCFFQKAKCIVAKKRTLFIYLSSYRTFLVDSLYNLCRKISLQLV